MKDNIITIISIIGRATSFVCKSLTLLFVAVTLFSCQKSPLTNGKVATETRLLSDFNSIYLYDNIDVTLINSDTSKIEITTGENILQNIVSDVNGDVLYIRNENVCNWLRSYDIPLEAKIYCSNDVREIVYESVGHLYSEGCIHNDSTSAFILTLEDGAGDISLNVNCDSLFLTAHTGTSNVNLRGKSSYSYIYQRGMGCINTLELPSKDMFVNSFKCNNTYIHCTEKLDARIYNMGNIYYEGHPEITPYIAPNAQGRIISIND